MAHGPFVSFESANKRVHVKEKYLMLILGYIFLFLHKNIYFGYSLKAP